MQNESKRLIRLLLIPLALFFFALLSTIAAPSVLLAKEGDAVAIVPAATITVVTAPQDMQVIPRDVGTNFGKVIITGTIAGAGLTLMQLDVERNNLAFDVVTQPVVYSGSSATFSFEYDISAELAQYTFKLSSIDSTATSLIATYSDIVAGDVYVIQGQSNAVARKWNGSANANIDTYVRTFGTTSDQSPTSNLLWGKAEGDQEYTDYDVGQWGLRLGKLLVDAHQVPIAIINGGRGGRAIDYFQRNDADHTDLASNYGRLLYRTNAAQVTDNVRGIFWYQGESDAGDAAGHESGWIALYNDWMANYPAIEHVYVMQLRNSTCGNDLELRDRQRRFTDNFPNVQTMSTTGINGHDGCHFAYADGYERLAERLFNWVSRDFYGSSVTQNIDPPNIRRAWFANTDYDTVIVELRDTNDIITFDSGAESDFDLEGSAVTVTGGVVVNNLIYLSLSADGSAATGLSYKGHQGAGAWVTNSTDVGLLAFYNVPVNLTPYSPTAVMLSQNGATTANLSVHIAVYALLLAAATGVLIVKKTQVQHNL